MNQEKLHKGSCQCGAVEYTLVGEPLTCYSCHCTRCQTLSGSAFTLSMVVSSDALEFGSVKPSEVRFLHKDTEVVRHFCEKCATTLWFSSDSIPGFSAIKPGTFNDTTWYKPVAHLWMSSAQPWVKLDDGIKQYDTQPEMRELVELWQERMD